MLDISRLRPYCRRVDRYDECEYQCGDEEHFFFELIGMMNVNINAYFSVETVV